MNAVTKVEAAPKNVYQRLSEARTKFHAMELKKTGKNTFANYSYFELGDFLIPALKVFAECGIGTTPVTFSDGYATMLIVNLENPQDYIELQSPMGSAALKGCHEVQNIGAVETYQRRYLWVNALEIVEHDALDSSPPVEAPKQQAPAKKPAQHSALKTELRGFVHELNGCGDADQLNAFLKTPDALRIVRETREKLPHLWDGDDWPEGIDRPEEFVPLSDVIDRRQRECAEATARYLTA
jgi:hypothetical protein